MNKRLKKKMLKKEYEISGIDRRYCEECGALLDPKDEYGKRYGTCDSTCYMHLVGMSWSDFM